MTTDKSLTVREGLDLTNIFETTQAEIDARLSHVWRLRLTAYEMYANSVMLDYAPDFAKLHRWGADLFGRPSKVNIITLSIQTLHDYIYVGWETGIANEFSALRKNGLTKTQIMEIVMFTQLYAGMRGLGHVYRAVGDFLPVWSDAPERAPFPDGWAPDPDAFKCGLDLTTRECTAADRKNLTDWYEKTIGYVPNSIAFGLKHHPEFIKVNRAKWEVAIKTLPKQAAPYMMIRQHMLTGNREGLREAAKLGIAWGMTPQWIIQGITATSFYSAGFESLYTAYDAVEDLL